jgi:septum formation protein
MTTPTLILASNSPRRRELLALTGWTFDVRPAAIDETPRPAEPPDLYVSRMARSKGEAAAALSPAGRLVLAADTIVADGPELLGKPSGPEQAAGMLRRLGGRTHQVYTAITVIETGGGQAALHIALRKAPAPQRVPILGTQQRVAADRCCSNVPMRAYHEAEIAAYVATGDPLDKAGAYAIQHTGFHPVEHFSGCYASVMGLPLCHLARTMQQLGYALPVDMAAACQASLEYACPVSSAILRGEDLG